MIIGITGYYASGKDTVAEYLETKSFYHSSLSDMIRDEIRRRGLKITRENLIKVGNELRQTRGNAVLAEMALEKIDLDKHYVFSSIRSEAEAKRLMQRQDFVLVRVTSPIQVRLQRIVARNSEEDPKTLDELKEKEAQERSNDPSKQQLHKVDKLAKVTITNNGNLEELNNKIDKFLKNWMPKLTPPRPSWDVYFMNITMQVARRSNCMKRKVAAIIVKDKRIISTGYNGTPRGVKNCNEGGCKRCNSFSAAGTNLSECLCSHGEENAIVQASYHGVPLKSTTLYTTFSPCLTCAKMIINSGITKVIYNMKYPLGGTAMKMLKEAGIKLKSYRQG